MRKLLNTLYITTPHSYLSLKDETIVVLLEEDEKFRIPMLNVENIVCFGYMGASPALMGKCAENNIGLSFLKPNGEFLSRVSGKTKGSVFLRKRQYIFSDDMDFCLKFSQDIVSAKLFNQRFTLEKTIRDNKEKINTEKLEKISLELKNAVKKAYTFQNLQELRGFEGVYAKLYFSVFDDMILHQKEDFYFQERSKRPPLDLVNCVLSYLYTILSLEIMSALETVGLDPYVGFFHALRSGRASLAVDLVEEFRSYLVDRTVISMINLKQINKKDFVQKEGGAVLMTDEGRKKILTIWQEKKKEIITHPFLEEKIEIGLLPYAQAQLLARYIRGDMNEYPTFLCK
ncbi:MAG: type I-C CRISPR-associated endonuclease Cas1c [Candidatus Cloacimonetes bacterium]|nr:type I-C CRISPR-associated endonuclease Cas1c [Candidatus Cloacimonadota bacterium]